MGDSHRGPVFDLQAHFENITKRNREQARDRLSKLGNLPPRPNLEWYRAEAKRRHHVAVRVSPSAKLSHTQDELAREHGFSNWPRFSGTVTDRNARAQRFSAKLCAHDDHAVIQALMEDPLAVVDAALEATVDDLAYLRRVGRFGAQPAVDTLHLVLFALARYGISRQLPWMLGAINMPHFDWESATTVLYDRQRDMELDPLRASEIEMIEEAISALAVYDEPEHDGELSED